MAMASPETLLRTLLRVRKIHFVLSLLHRSSTVTTPINIMRRILQDHGVEVIHLGHNRSVEVVAALNEDADGDELVSRWTR